MRAKTVAPRIEMSETRGSVKKRRSGRSSSVWANLRNEGIEEDGAIRSEESPVDSRIADILVQRIWFDRDSRMVNKRTKIEAVTTAAM